MKISLHETFETFPQKKMVKFDSKSKMCNSYKQHNYENGSSLTQDQRTKWSFIWKQTRNVTWTYEKIGTTEKMRET